MLKHPMALSVRGCFKNLHQVCTKIDFKAKRKPRRPCDERFRGFVIVKTLQDYLLEFLHWRFTAFYIVRNAHIVGYCGGVIAYRLIFFVLSHRMLHQISTKITPRLASNLFDKLSFTLSAFRLLLPWWKQKTHSCPYCSHR